MKCLLGVLFMMMSSETFVYAKEILPATLERPLITGASVSADWSSPSPGKKLALRYTEAKKVKTIAFGGTPGVEVWKRVSEGDLRDRTAILALDLFFWDSTLPSAEKSLLTLREVVAASEKHKIPLVLGEIPELLPGRQGMRQTLNAAIAKACEAQARCYLMPFDQLHRKVTRDGYLEIRGKKHLLRDLVPDGLHLAPLAGDYLADVLESVLKSN